MAFLEILMGLQGTKEEMRKHLKSRRSERHRLGPKICVLYWAG